MSGSRTPRALMALALVTSVAAATQRREPAQPTSRDTRAGSLPDTVRRVATDEEGQPASLPALPHGMTVQTIRDGDAIYRGAGGCAGCHGVDAAGVPDRGNALTMALIYIPKPHPWAAIDSLVTAGIPEVVTRTSVACPPRGEGSRLSPEQVRQVAAYVWALTHTRGEPWRGGHASHPTAGRR